MTWIPVICVYILVGGFGALGLARGGAGATAQPLDPTGAFVLICGAMALWPLLLALAIDRGRGDD